MMDMVKHLMLNSLILSIAGMVLASRCKDGTDTCTSRIELAVDFASFLAKNCTFVPNCACRAGMDLVYYNHAPYIFHDSKSQKALGILPDILNEAVNLCCFGCNRLKYMPPISGITEMFNSELKNKSYNAIFPILATTTIKEYFAGPFISMISTPGVVLVTNTANEEETFDHMIRALSGTWPLLVLAILMSLNAGFVVWAIDTRHNKEDFPRSFPQGALEGGWWAFVSMTTVGYGDKCPRSLVSRIFAMIWIVFGIAICGMFTASLTSALTASFTTTKIDIGKKKIGLLNITRYEHNIALREGATPVAFGTIPEMKDALKSGTVNGLLIDRNVLGYNWDYLKAGMKLTVKTGITNSDTTYGIMFVTQHFSNATKKLSAKWATYLSTFFNYNKDNQDVMISMAKSKLNKQISHEPFKVPVVDNGFTKDVYMMLFKYVGVMTGVLTGFGIIYEIIRRWLTRNKGISCNTMKNAEETKCTDDDKSRVNGTAIVEIEMEDLAGKAERLIHNLEEIVQEMKSLRKDNIRA